MHVSVLKLTGERYLSTIASKWSAMTTSLSSIQTSDCIINRNTTQAGLVFWFLFSIFWLCGGVVSFLFFVFFGGEGRGK